MADRAIVHIDLNAFFAQCEVNANPALKGKPIAVGGDHKRGIVSTASYEARKFGVHSAMPSYQAKKACPGLIFVEGHYSLYSKVSHRFMSYLREKYPLLEQVSIDECYIDMSGIISDSSAHDYLTDLQVRIFMDLSLKCSIGYGHTRFLAKMASDFKKPLGLTLVVGDNYKDLFWPLPIEKMWGIGKKTAPRLREEGINTIQDLAVSTSPKVKETLGSSYQTFKEWANGQGSDVVDPSDFDRKSISSEETLLTDSDDPDLLKSMMKSLLREVVTELAKENKKSSTLVLILRDSSFKTRSKRISLGQPSSSYSFILPFAVNLFESFYDGSLIRLIGVGLDDTKEVKEDGQGKLFNTSLDVEEAKEESRKGESEALLKKLNSGSAKGLFTTLGAKGDKKG